MKTLYRVDPETSEVWIPFGAKISAIAFTGEDVAAVVEGSSLDILDSDNGFSRFRIVIQLERLGPPPESRQIGTIDTAKLGRVNVYVSTRENLPYTEESRSRIRELLGV